MNEMIAAILTLVEQLAVNTSEQFIEAVINRLNTFGYTVTAADEWMVAFCIQKVNLHIMNSCNTSSVPDGLFYVAVDRVCGEFLFGMMQSGQLELENLDLGGAITQIREGDTTVEFGSGTSDDEKFTAFLNYLRNEGEGDFICYRKLKW